MTDFLFFCEKHMFLVELLKILDNGIFVAYDRVNKYTACVYFL
jgi:hypothetical protein